MDRKFKLQAHTVTAMEQELTYLQTIRWKEIEEMLEEARLYGDLSENLEYEVARTEQEKCLARMNDIEHILSHAVVVDEAGQEQPYHFSERPKAEEISLPTSGTCGENLRWKLLQETLYIFGTGPMDNYDASPWYDQNRRAQFCRIVIEEGAATIGSYAFAELEIEGIVIPESVKTIESCAFFNATIGRLELRDTLETLKPNIISADPCCIGTLVLSVNIPHIQWEAFSTRYGAPKEIVLTGMLPENLDDLVHSKLFVFPAERIWYPGEWDAAGESVYDKLARKIGELGGYCDLPVYTEEDYAKLKKSLIPMA